MKKNKPHLKKTEVTEASEPVVENSRRWRLVGLGAVLILLVGVFYWNQFVRPQQLIAQANALAKSNPAEAERLLRQALMMTGSLNPDQHMLRIALLVQTERSDEAIAELNDLYDKVKLPPEKLQVLAGAAVQQQNFLLAESLLYAGMWDEDARLPLNQQLLELHVANGNTEGMIRTCNSILKLDPNDAVALRLLGTQLHTQKRHVEAEDAFRKSVEFSKNNDQKQFAWQLLIGVLVDQGKVESARKEVDAYKQLFPNDIDIALKEAMVCRLEGNLQQGLAATNRYIGVKQQASPEAYYIRGLLYVDLNEDQKAIDDLTKVIDPTPWNHEAHFKLAVAFQRLGNKQKADAHRKLAERYRDYRIELLELSNKLRESPTDRLLRKRVAELYELLGSPQQAAQLRRSRAQP